MGKMFNCRALPSSVLLLFLVTTCAAEKQPSSSSRKVDSAAGGSNTVLEFYMHDVRGGSNPAAKHITGRPMNKHNGQMELGKHIVGLEDGDNHAGSSRYTGLSGTAVVRDPQGPISTGQVQTLLGPDGPGPAFGTINVVDEAVTSTPEIASKVIGRAQGVNVASSSDGTTQMMALTVTMGGGKPHVDSLNLSGMYNARSKTSRLTVAGGTGMFKLSRGYAEIRPSFPKGRQMPDVADSTETLLRITAHLTY